MKKIVTIAVLVILINFISFFTFAFATQGNLSLSEKEIIEKLARLEEGHKALNKRIDDVNKRLDDLRIDLKGDIEGLRSELKGDIEGLRIDLKGDIEGLRSEVKEDIADLRGLMYVVIAGIIALIGFVIWDRRTALSPVIHRTKELEEREDLTMRALKEYAIKEPKMAEVLKSLGML